MKRMPDHAAAEFVIEGVTATGQPFRPSDWAERLCGIMAAFGGDHRMQYSPYVYPVTARGVRAVVVDLRLESIEPMAFRFLVGFAEDNELRTRRARLFVPPGAPHGRYAVALRTAASDSTYDEARAPFRVLGSSCPGYERAGTSDFATVLLQALAEGLGLPL